MSSGGFKTPSTLVLFLQSLACINIFFALFSVSGWYALVVENVNTYTFSPLRSCYYSYLYSFRFKDDFGIYLCQKTTEFTSHVSREDHEITDKVQVVQLLARFLLGISTVAVAIFLLDLCARSFSKLFQFILLSFQLFFLVAQSIVLMKLYSDMSCLTTSVGNHLELFHFKHGNDTSKPFVYSESDLLPETVSESTYGFGFYLAMLATFMLFGATFFAVYKLIDLCMGTRDDMESAGNMLISTSPDNSVVRCINMRKKDYRRIDEIQTPTLGANTEKLLISQGVEHWWSHEY